MKKIEAVPTNIITGFLGVGKTTAILHLLKSKPDNERWAILVNEFGEIGVDGSLFEGQHTKASGVFIREVPGGCMCCTAGLPMQIALNQLLTRAKPQRLLIEPTGLGHPKGVLQVLNADHYKSILDIQQCITLVDARKLHDSRYTQNDTFNQQIDIADIIVGNKQDLYQDGDKVYLKNYIAARNKKNKHIFFATHGKLDINILHGSSQSSKDLSRNSHEHLTRSSPTMGMNEAPLPECGFLKTENSGEGYCSFGWRFCADKVFDRKTLLSYLSDIRTERIKAVFITNEGIFGYNATADALTEFELDDCLESRIEIIETNNTAEISVINEEGLLNCLIIPHGLVG